MLWLLLPWLLLPWLLLRQACCQSPGQRPSPVLGHLLIPGWQVLSVPPSSLLGWGTFHTPPGRCSGRLAGLAVPALSYVALYTAARAAVRPWGDPLRMPPPLSTKARGPSARSPHRPPPRPARRCRGAFGWPSQAEHLALALQASSHDEAARAHSLPFLASCSIAFQSRYVHLAICLSPPPHADSARMWPLLPWSPPWRPCPAQHQAHCRPSHPGGRQHMDRRRWICMATGRHRRLCPPVPTGLQGLWAHGQLLVAHMMQVALS